MGDRASDIRSRLELAEMQAASIVADHRLPALRDIQTDRAWRAFIANALDPARHKQNFDTVRLNLWAAETGSMDSELAFDEAESILRVFDNTRQVLAEIIATRDSAKVQRAQNQKREAGKVEKRRKWADVLSENISDWDDIPDSSDELTVDTTAVEYAFYQDGERVYCIDAISRVEIGSLARSTVEKRYLKKQAGQKRR